jgi:hypothetical protein
MIFSPTTTPNRYLPALFTLPDNLLAFLYLSCAAIPRYVAKKDLPDVLDEDEGGAPVPKKKKATRNSNNVIVGETSGDVCELASWIFGNIAYVLVRIVASFLYSALACLLSLPPMSITSLLLQADIEAAKEDLVFVPGTERDEAPQPMSEDQLQELTRKMDILYRHFFKKWELIGKDRYLGRSIKKRARLFDEVVDDDKENQQEPDINIVEEVLPVQHV